MKRVHDWKEPIESDGGDAASRKSGGRKRKTGDSTAQGRPVQRKKTKPEVSHQQKPIGVQEYDNSRPSAADQRGAVGDMTVGGPVTGQDQRRSHTANRRWIATSGSDPARSVYVQDLDGTIDMARLGRANSQAGRHPHGSGFRLEG